MLISWKVNFIIMKSMALEEQLALMGIITSGSGDEVFYMALANKRVIQKNSVSILLRKVTIKTRQWTSNLLAK